MIHNIILAICWLLTLTLFVTSLSVAAQKESKAKRYDRAHAIKMTLVGVIFLLVYGYVLVHAW